MSDIVNVGGGSNPVGTIISFMGITAPAGYLFCDGTVYNISDYPGLADHFETQFGAKEYFGGDGVDTFAVPDLQGEFLRCTGTNSHTNQGSGANVGEHQDGTIQNRMFVNSSNSAVVIESDLLSTACDYIYYTDGRRYTITSGSYSSSTNQRSFIARPTNTSVLYCIKY